MFNFSRKLTNRIIPYSHSIFLIPETPHNFGSNTLFKCISGIQKWICPFLKIISSVWVDEKYVTGRPLHFWEWVQYTVHKSSFFLNIEKQQYIFEEWIVVHNACTKLTLKIRKVLHLLVQKNIWFTQEANMLQTGKLKYKL